MGNRRTTARLAVLAVAATVLVAGCSDDDGSNDGDEKRRSPQSLSEGYSVRGALAEIPASAVDDDVLVQTADLRAATEAAGLDVPTDGSREATSPWLSGLTDASSESPTPVFVPFGESFNLQAAAPEEFAELLGWSVLDVDSFVELSVPPGRFAVVTGDFDDDTLSSDLTEVGDGVVTDVEGEDFENHLDAVNAANRLGVPTRLARQEDRIALSPSTPAVESWLEGGDSLADDDSLAAVADALDDEGAISAVLTRVEGGADPASAVLGSQASPEQLEALNEQLEGSVPEDPFDAVGIGWSVDDGEAEVHVAYHFDSTDAARDGAEVLEKTYREGTSSVSRTPYSDYLDVEDVDADGPVVTVTVTPAEQGRTSFLYQALQQRELLFVSR
ncbi:hypothetical protein [Nocardioides sp. Root151]|uniref:hypothetical protein n=1 Tax=Nocardioides sp. Root151 TaxID=1736475 RepID=UPI000714F584|nr:hypothetical protein [Nocardioides sp. Root151]KQZ66804.1 hypothetical protein ASD66_17355 [Nocardioides sp. Root151]